MALWARNVAGAQFREMEPDGPGLERSPFL